MLDFPLRSDQNFVIQSELVIPGCDINCVSGINPSSQPSSIKFLNSGMAFALPLWCEVKVSASKAIPTAGYHNALVSFQYVRNGRVLALHISRRSGAQRGASENNFGQRFSVSTPCFSRLKMTPPPRTLGQELN